MALGVHTLGTNIPNVPIRYATHLRCVHTSKQLTLRRLHLRRPHRSTRNPQMPTPPPAVRTPPRSATRRTASTVTLEKVKGVEPTPLASPRPPRERDRAFPFLVVRREPPGNLYLFLPSKQEVAPRLAAASGSGHR